MEQVMSINLPLAGKIQHGEQQTNNGKKRVVELGYFIAKIKSETLSYLVNRFNERYIKSNTIDIRFFDENPLTIKRVRYNQSGAICYCMYNETQAKQKTANGWKAIDCTDTCQYKLSANENSKPMCNFEGTLKFLLPNISKDRIWYMKISGQTSINRLKEYIDFQKHLGNSIIGDYTLFLKKEEQTNREGKKFTNHILDIIKKDDFNSNEIPLQPTSQEKISQNNENTINNITDSKENIDGNKKVETNTENTNPNLKANEKKSTKSKKTNTVKEDKVDPISENNKEEFSNYYILVETYNKTITNAGKPTEYLIGNFADMNDDTIDVIIPPEFKDELLSCDIGTTVVLDLATRGEKTYTKNIKYIQKYQKNIAA